MAIYSFVWYDTKGNLHKSTFFFFIPPFFLILQPEGHKDFFFFIIMEAANLEQFLIAWVSLHLNKGLPVDPANSLATYGLDSIRAVLLTDDTQNRFGFEWPPYLFFEEISISQLATEGQKLMEEL
jgi:acyl carrier protein